MWASGCNVVFRIAEPTAHDLAISAYRVLASPKAFPTRVPASLAFAFQVDLAFFGCKVGESFPFASSEAEAFSLAFPSVACQAFIEPTVLPDRFLRKPPPLPFGLSIGPENALSSLLFVQAQQVLPVYLLIS